jgi:hypothetical protein
MKIKLSKKQWQFIGKQAGWMKTASAKMGDPTKEEMLNYLQSLYGQEEGWKDEAEVAIYYFGNDWHGGQFSNLYSAMSTSPYSPGPISTLESEGDFAKMMYEDLEREFMNKSDEEKKDV